MALDSVVLLRVVYLVMATGLETFYSFTGKKKYSFSTHSCVKPLLQPNSTRACSIFSTILNFLFSVALFFRPGFVRRPIG